MAVGIPVFVDVGLGPATGLRKDSHSGISKDAVVGFTVLTVDQTADSTAFARDWRCADREAALIKNLLGADSIDLSRSPRADAGYPGVLQVRIDVDAILAFSGRPEPATVGLVLKQMPLSAVVEIGGSFERPRRGYPVVRHKFFVAQNTVQKTVPVYSDRIFVTNRPVHSAKVFKNRISNVPVWRGSDWGCHGRSDSHCG